MDKRWFGLLTAPLQLIAGLPFFLSNLIAPDAGVKVMYGIWVAFTVLAIVVFRRNPPLSVAVPGFTVLAGIAGLVFGGTFLGWEG